MNPSNQVTLLTHFSEPRWPIVNKLSGIAKCLNVDLVHCAQKEKLFATLPMLSGQRVLFFTDESLIEVVEELAIKFPQTQLEIAMFIHSPIAKVAKAIAKSLQVKYLLGIESIDGSGRDLSILVKKFAAGDVLDLEKYLAFGSNIHQKIIRSAADKREAVETIYSYISQLGDSGYDHPFNEYATRVCEMVDELLLNAIFDANSRLSNADRSQPFALKEEEQIEMAWGYDGEYFGASVCDPFGNFNCETIMKYVASQREREAIAASASGGLGLKLIFERAHQVIANVQRQTVTEVIVLVRFENRLLEFEKRKKSFFYFSKEQSTSSKVK